MMIDRRSVVTGAALSLVVPALRMPLANATSPAVLGFGAPHAFSFDDLTNEMRSRAGRPYMRETGLPQNVLDLIDYEQHGKIQFNTDYALFKDGPGQFPVTFFHLGKYFRTPVRMYVLAAAGKSTSAREVLYDPDYFFMPADSPARKLPRGAGFAGFRFQESRLSDKLDWRRNDWVAFLGASYFRAIGDLHQYGLSARAVAVDVAVPGRQEEFPDFTRFYFEPAAEGARQVTVYAALDGPSVTGAFKFQMQRDQAVMMEVDARLFLRSDVSQLGVAPMTSMFWFSETEKPEAIDWRPEIHDSDGLVLATGTGEYIWRPLSDARRPSTSTFNDKAPRGFGLLQRDRVFDHYLDGVRYDHRPSLWQEPLNDWHEGAVQLIELPTDDEVHDNIVAMWVPKEPAKAGSSVQARYRLYWSSAEPHQTTLGRCVATRLGRGGEPGHVRPPGVHKFVVEFLGGPLAKLPPGVKPQPILTASSGTFSDVFSEAVPDDVQGHWRAEFDFTPSGSAAADLRLFLRNGSQTLTETWLYQYRPADTA